MHLLELFISLAMLSAFTVVDAARIPHRRQLFVPAAPAIGTIVGGWTVIGCYYDQSSPRTFKDAMLQGSSTVSQDSCIAYCAARGMMYAGVECEYPASTYGSQG
jgi:hypothetical protein